MAKEKNNGKNKNGNGKNGKGNTRAKVKDSLLTSRTKRWIKAILMFLVAIVVGLSFFNKAGTIGRVFMSVSKFLMGNTIFSIPLFLFLGGLIFLKSKKRNRAMAMFLAIIISIVGISGILASRDLTEMQGGWIGFLMSKLFVGLFGILVANIIFAATMLIGLFIFLQFIWSDIPKEKKEEEKKPLFVFNKQGAEGLKVKREEVQQEKAKTASSRIFLFKKGKDEKEEKDLQLARKDKKSEILSKSNYILPPLELLSKNESAPTSGNIKENSMLIKSTLENFGIPVEMAEINIGPTVTQYAFKPAEGVKLSKITTLSNNLALALAAHPIRIEAPIPGKSLVGIEVPNKVRATIMLRNLISHPNYQSATTPLVISLGKNVSGSAGSVSWRSSA
ncbi:MAG: DNA translocase FtsK 4TM domain-containing protein, partial [Patescibacteria group bacterium]